MASQLGFDRIGTSTGLGEIEVLNPLKGTGIAGMVLKSETTDVTASAPNTTFTSSAFIPASLDPLVFTTVGGSHNLVTLYIGRSLAYGTGGIGFSLWYSLDGVNFVPIPNGNSGDLHAFNYTNSGEQQAPVVTHARHNHGLPKGSTIYYRLYVKSWVGNAQRAIANDSAGGTVHWNIQEIA